jgi:cytochrome c oxidase subunit 2
VNAQSVLHPAGPAAERIAALWWLMLAAAVIVLLLVLWVLLRAFTHRGERSELHRHGSGDAETTRWVVAGGVGLPLLVLTPLFLFTLHTLGALSPPARGALEIVVTGRQWWWDVEYMGGEAAEPLRTANEIHIPVGQPVRVRLRAADVIHSFWAPALQGKLDLIPGRENLTWIQADSAGVYRGACAEYCGLQHARMGLLIVAQPPDEFERWRTAQAQPAAGSTDTVAAGRGVFMRAGCPLCHTVRGTEARGRTGPDLTHLASRRTLAAAALPNTPGHLSGWIANPQALKRGTRMPRVPLESDELHALVGWLRTLH